MDVTEGLIIGGKFRLERPLAKGGMGSVWVARHLQLDVDVAVKFMDPELASSASARVRFEREAKASALIKSPHVVQVHDYGVEGDTPYIAMELLHGVSLAAHLRRSPDRRLTLAQAARILDPICRGLRRAHDAGVIHRDLKPSNVFLVRQDEEEHVKILDFGIAKTLSLPTSGEATRTGSLVGSPFYMSPEQVRRAKEDDHRSDLWTVGVIAYQMLTGKLPFGSDEVGAVLVAICTEPFPLATTLVPELGPEVDAFFARALARAPAERFQTARQLAEAFAELTGERPNPLSFSGTHAGLPSTPPTPAPTSMGAVGVSSDAARGEGTLSPADRSSPGTPRGARRGVMVGVAAVAAIVLGVVILATRGASAPPAVAATAPVPTAEPSPPPPLAAAPSVSVAPAPSASLARVEPTPAARPAASAPVTPLQPTKKPAAAPPAPPPNDDVRKRIGL